MMELRHVLVSVAVLAPIASSQAHAGAWPYQKGKGQLITSLETAQASAAFDSEGHLSVPLDIYKQTELSFFGQYGLSDRITLFTKSGYQSYDTEFESFSGVPSIEAGVRYNVIHTQASVVSLSASVEGLGRGQRSDFEVMGNTGTDTEMRLLYGRNTRLIGYPAFLNMEAAYRQRSSAPDQTRLDVTVGVKLNSDWLFMSQVFAGQTAKGDDDYQGRWVNTQFSLARSFGKTTLQLGWRKMVAGRYVPEKSTLIVSLWRDF